ncbi:hypothetical protein RHGRI_023910 [Rhododendron griersonianum]|uniref:Uncharacterized protein n=1 Tax=Rhododendron griersonianum TaxID=479676 RepID=A0AAV6J581_9ERIC|nr:hypothetical protein RHGRI_023910 [Rhododendron griersonianum]
MLSLVTIAKLNGSPRNQMAFAVLKGKYAFIRLMFQMIYWSFTVVNQDIHSISVNILDHSTIVLPSRHLV